MAATRAASGGFSASRMWRCYRYWVTGYRRTWRGSVVSTAVNPVLYLAAMGVGLGSLIRAAPGSAELSYLQFIAPGLVAATAMQVAAIEATYPVLASVKWIRTYHAMLATPLSVADVFVGHLLWVLTRVAMSAAFYLAAVAAFGGIRSVFAVAAVPISLLVGAAFAAPIAAFAVVQEHDNGFSALQRFVIVPMFLFSGTFFAVSQLPSWIRPLAYLTPLWHGVALTRDATTGILEDGGWPMVVVHLSFLIGCAAVGSVVAARNFRHRLVE